MFCFFLVKHELNGIPEELRVELPKGVFVRAIFVLVPRIRARFVGNSSLSSCCLWLLFVSLRVFFFKPLEDFVKLTLYLVGSAFCFTTCCRKLVDSFLESVTLLRGFFRLLLFIVVSAFFGGVFRSFFRLSICFRLGGRR